MTKPRSHENDGESAYRSMYGIQRDYRHEQ